MAITLTGAKISSLSIEMKDSATEVKGVYALMSSAGKVVASQSFNGYNDLKVEMTKDTRLILEKFLAAYATEINGTIGLGDSQ